MSDVRLTSGETVSESELNAVLLNALMKLKWGAGSKSFSVDLNAEECSELLALIEEYVPDGEEEPSVGDIAIACGCAGPEHHSGWECLCACHDAAEPPAVARDLFDTSTGGLL